MEINSDNNGYRQFDNDTFGEMLKEQELGKKPIDSVEITGFMCSSSEVANGVFDKIGQSIDCEQQKGLLSLEIVWYVDQNKLEEWPLSQLVAKAPYL